VAAFLALSPASLIADDGAKSTKGTPGPPEVASIASSRVLVGYRTRSNSPLPTTAELWYTLDRGQTWHKSPKAQSGENPVPFDAPEDGLYGFYLILHAESGASAEPPKPGFAPQQWVRVDRGVPVVQLLRLAPDERFDLNRQVYIRWGVQDDNLPDRPTALHYRTEDGKSFEPIADTLPANSSYLWTVPEGVRGRVEIKVSANDRAGNSGRYVADWLRVEDSSATVSRSPETGGQRVALPSPREAELKPNAPPRSTGAVNLTVNQVASKSRPTAEMAVQPTVAPSYSEPEPGPKALPQGAAEEARKKYDLGTWHRLRGDYAVAVARFREALALDPGLLAARNDLAGALYLQGDHEGAEKELTEVLAEDPGHKAALKTLALVQVTRRNYRSSAASLEKLLLLDETDAEAWLYLGDVRLFMGERSAARDAWAKAGSTEAASEETKERAEKRLTMYRADRLAGPGSEQP
jgi:tetratricopeptide (TPR) repeat protein